MVSLVNSPEYHKVNRLADIIMVTALVVVAAVVSIVLTSSYKKLWRSALKNGSTLTVFDTAPKDQAPIIEKPAEPAPAVEAVQAPIGENQNTRVNLCSEPIMAPNDTQETHPQPLSNLEQQAPVVAVEALPHQATLPEGTKVAEPQTSGKARRKRRATHTRSTRRAKKLSEAQRAAVSPPS